MDEPARETGKYVRFLEPALAKLCGAQQGVISLEQLNGLGLTKDAVRKRVAVGRLHRIHHAVYSLVPRELLKREGLYMAAVLACGPGAVLSHRAAAVLHELRDWGATKIDVTLPRRSRRHHDGLKIHCSTTLSPADVTVVNGIPVTTVARTLFDLAEAVTQRQLERSFDQAELAGVFDLRAIEDQLARNPTRPGAKKVRRVLTEHYIGKTPTWSENEEALLAITRAAGLPDPETNYFIDPGDGGRPIRVDFAWPDQRVVVEADSRKWHLSHQRFEGDRERDQRLTAAGWRVIRTTWRQMKFRPHELRVVLLKLLGPGPPTATGKPVSAGARVPGPRATSTAGGSTS
jgi:hypothetical protein